LVCRVIDLRKTADQDADSLVSRRKAIRRLRYTRSAMHGS
jgi:hypothetical protein